jgi:hypothetical protein
VTFTCFAIGDLSVRSKKNGEEEYGETTRFCMYFTRDHEDASKLAIPEKLWRMVRATLSSGSRGTS